MRRLPNTSDRGLGKASWTNEVLLRCSLVKADAAQHSSERWNAASGYLVIAPGVAGAAFERGSPPFTAPVGEVVAFWSTYQRELLAQSMMFVLSAGAYLWFFGREQTMAVTSTAARTRTINIRIEEERRTLIDRAAEAAGKDRTQFVLDAATREATTVLLGQRYFQLDSDAFAKFNAALDASPAENPRLRALPFRKARWER